MVPLRLSTSIFYGPSLYSKEKIILFTVDAEPFDKLIEAENLLEFTALSKQIFGASQNELEQKNALGKASCIAKWALDVLNFKRGYLHSCGARQVRENLVFWVGFHKPDISLEVVRFGLSQLAVGIDRKKFETALRKIWVQCRHHHPDYQARILLTAARHRDIPALSFINKSRYWQFGWGLRSRQFFESMSSSDGLIGGILAGNKSISKSAFGALGLPTPKHTILNSRREIENILPPSGYPCVVKPLDQGGGRGITAGIENEQQLIAAIEIAQGVTTGPIMLEEFVPGSDYRLMVIGGAFVAAIRREPSQAIGDGVRRLENLIAEINAGRSDDIVKSHYLRPIEMDRIFQEHIKRQGVSLTTVLAKGQRISLRSVSNLSAGGICIDVTENIHPSLIDMAINAAVTLGLDVAGFDYMTTDISRPPWETAGAFIEMNTTPGLDVVIAAGWSPEKIGGLVLGEHPGRIPVELYISSQALGHQSIVKSGKPGVAKIAGRSFTIGPVQFSVEDETPWETVKCALRQRTVVMAEIYCTLDDILLHGLPIDRFEKIILSGVDAPKELLDFFKTATKKLCLQNSP